MATSKSLSALALVVVLLALDRLPEPYSCYVMRGVVRVSLPAPGFRMPAGAFVPDSAVVGYTDDGTFRNCADDIYVPLKYKPRRT